MKKRIFPMLAALSIFLVALLIGFNFWLSFEKTQPFHATASEIEQLTFYQQSEDWFKAHLQKPAIQIDGQTFNPKIQYMFEQYGDPDRNRSFLENMFSVPLLRKYIRYSVDRNWTLYTKTSRPMKETHDLLIDGSGGHKIPIRIYVPETDTTGEKMPVLIYAHGGGYLFSSIKAVDRAVRLIANEAKVIVISVDYRLAPEHPYPAASDDGEDVFLWTREHALQYNGDPDAIAFGGDSAGGHVAINVAQRQLAAGKPGPAPAMLLLYYPATDLPMKDRSYQLFGKGFGLDASFFQYLLTKVFPDQNPDSPRLDDYMVPARAKSLKGMPPAIIATAGFDILRDSGARLAEKLRADGVAVEYFNYSSLSHSFLQFSAIVGDADVAATETAHLFGKQIRIVLKTDVPNSN